MGHNMNADGAADVTLNASKPQRINDADGNPLHPIWLILRGKGTAVTVTVEAGGVIDETQSIGAGAERDWNRAVAADDEQWVWIGGTEVGIGGDVATAISVATIP